MKCICQVCSCGKHKCPHFTSAAGERNPPVTNKDPCKVSEYREEYKKETRSGPRSPIRHHRPTDCIKSEGDVEFGTTHQQTYAAHPIAAPPRRKAKKENKVVIRSTPMQGNSEYGKSFKKLEKVQPPTPPGFINKKTVIHPNDGKPVEVSVTQTDYEFKGVPEKPVVKKLNDSYVPSKEPLDAKSVHHTDYTKFNEPPRPSGRVPDNLTHRGQPAYFDTTNRSHYVRHEHQPPVPHPHPSRVGGGGGGAYVPTTEPFSGSSLMKADYGVHENRVKSCPVKHDNQLFASDEAMPNLTTNSAMYKSWGARKPPAVKEPARYRPPSKEMDLQKTSDDYAYLGPPKPSKSLRPKTNIALGGDFDPSTENTQQYIKHDVRVPLKPIIASKDREYRPSTEPFQGHTENKDHYKVHQGTPAKMVRRVNVIFDKTPPMDAHTSYASDYATKILPVCPITEGIVTNFNGLEMVEVGNGHKCLQPAPLPPINDNKAASLVAVN